MSLVPNYLPELSLLCIMSCVWFFVTPWTIAPELLCPWTLLGRMHWSGLPHPTPGDTVPNSGMEPVSLASPTLIGIFFATVSPWNPPTMYIIYWPYVLLRVLQVSRSCHVPHWTHPFSLSHFSSSFLCLTSFHTGIHSSKMILNIISPL